MSELKMNSQTKKIIHNIVCYYEDESSLGAFSVPLSNVLKRAAVVARCHNRTISNIKKFNGSGYLRNKNKKNNMYDLSYTVCRTSLLNLRQAMNKIFFDYNISAPSTRDIQRVSRLLQLHCNMDNVRHILRNKICYKYLNEGNETVIERYSSRLARAMYLYEIQKNDDRGVNAMPVIYIDENLIRLHFERTPENKNRKRLWIHVIAGGIMGFVPGTTHFFNVPSIKTKMTSSAFINWVSLKLIPNLPLNSLVVMDNASIHNDLLNQVPDINASKMEMTDWLDSQGIAYETDMLKLQLHDLITKNKLPKEYRVDNMLRQHGHKVLRLPPYTEELSPIKSICDIIDKKFAVITSSTVVQTEIHIGATISSVGMEDWLHAMNKVKKVENQFRECDAKMESCIPYNASKDYFYDTESDVESELEYIP